MVPHDSSTASETRSSEQTASSEALPVCERIISGEISPSIGTTRRSAEDPILTRFRAALLQIQSSELERLYNRLPGLDEGSRQAIRHFADCLVAKMLYPPLNSLRDDVSSGSSTGLLNALEELFRLSE
jgi:glutamyl-tRNA reductase